jgi:hypothetical protein
MTNHSNTDDIYDNNSEASRAKGVRPKGSQSRSPPPAGKVKVVPIAKKKIGISALAKYQLTVLTVNTVAGLALISDFVVDPSMQAHMMWAYGIANGIAMVPSFLKQE